MTASATSTTPHRRWSWRTCAATAAHGWAWFLAAMGVYWWAGGAGYPFGHNDINGPNYSSLLAGMENDVGGPAIALFGIAASVAAGQLDRRDHRPRRRRLVVGAGVTVALTMAGVVLDGRMITLLPPLGIIPIGWLKADWPTLFQATIAVGATLFFLASVAYAERTGDSSPKGLRRRQRIASAWIRAGRVATFLAMVCPLPYAVIRLAWSRGWAVGAPEPFVASLLENQPENVFIEPILAAFALSGAVLTSGLLFRWGRVFPTWIPVLRGQIVPMWFPLMLGGSAVIGIFAFGRGLLFGQLGVRLPGQLDTFQLWGQPIDDGAYWGADGLGWFFFPLWAISLAVALTGYYFRYTPARPAADEAEAGTKTSNPADPLLSTATGAVYGS